MANPVFRDAQMRARYDDHIAAINRLVDELRDSERGWLPYVAPIYGGVHARLLSLLRDPGPKTQADTGSGFLSMENNDATAEAISTYFTAVGIHATEIVPWNVYPWYINRSPKAEELEAGVEPLRRLVELLPHLRVVMLHGGSAAAGWKRFTRRHAGLLASRSLIVIPTYHTSRQAFWHRDERVRQVRRDHLRAAFDQAARSLAATEQPGR